MNLRRAKDEPGWEPDFPEGISFGLLADLKEVNWGIYQFTQDLDEEWTPSKPVDAELEALVWSGKRYPPALAIARHDMTHQFDSHRPTQDEFAKAYAVSIRSRLSEQAQAPFLMARALRGCGIDLAPGEWYWVLRVRGEPLVASWVSDDYFVYQAPVSHFDLTDEQIEQLR